MKSLVTAFALIVLSAGCKDGTGSGPGREMAGTVSFTHTGAGGASSTFRAAGAVPANRALGDWAGGVRMTDDGEMALVIWSSTPSGGDYDMLAIELDGEGAGTYAIGACEARCAAVGVVFGKHVLTDAGEYGCTLHDGAVVVSSVSRDRARGTFSGAGTCATADGDDWEFSVSAGSFDVPLVDGDAPPGL